MKREKNKKEKALVSAFTVLEVTIVVAIMALLISLISISLNRFNEQLKLSSDLRQELNQWFAFRSNLWREFYDADSMNVENSTLSIHKGMGSKIYSTSDGRLLRKGVDGWLETGLNAESIILEKVEEGDYIIIDFVWKGQVMEMKYLDYRDPKTEIENYFNNLK